MSAQPPQKPALATLGVSAGGAGGTLVLGLLVAKLTSDGFSFARDWQAVAGYLLALGALYGWAWLTARRPEIQTGLRFFDGPKDGGGGAG